MNSSLMKVLKGVAGILVLLMLISTVSRWWGDYRTSGAPAGSSTTTTSTASPEGEDVGEGADSEGDQAAPERKTVLVLTEGLNFRKDPSRDSDVIRGLAKGEKMTLIKTESGWHQVEAEDGTRGWISANTTYSEVQ